MSAGGIGMPRGAASRWLAVVLAGAVGLLWPAIVNGFPLIFEDSMDYIMLTPRVYRSPFYQLFVFLTGLKLSVWTVIAMQALLAAGVSALLLRLEAGARPRAALIALAVLCVGSTLPVFAAFVMPDAFTGIMFVAIYLLVFHWPAMARWQRAAVFLLALTATAVHLSHLAMAAAMTVVALGLLRLRDGRATRWAGAGAAGLVVAATALASLLYSIAVFHTVAISPAGSTFFAANLIEMGPARDELAATCPARRYRLCRYQGHLPPTADSLLWAGGPFMAIGFDAIRDEAASLVHDTLRDRPGEVLRGAAGNAARALVAVAPAPDIVPRSGEARSAVALIYGERAGRVFAESLQERDRFPRHAVDVIAVAGLVAALVALVGLGLRAGWHRSPFALYALLALACDATVCGTLSGVHDRYQSRMCWLIPLAALSLAIGRRQRSAGPLAPTPASADVGASEA